MNMKAVLGKGKRKKYSSGLGWKIVREIENIRLNAVKLVHSK